MGRKAAGGTLYAPGERKGSGSFVWRGRIAGELVEVSTRTTSRRDAIAFLRDFIPAKREQLLAERGRARQGAPRTFAAVAMAYSAAVGLSRVNQLKLDRCAAARFRLEPSEPWIQLGEMAIEEIWQMHIAATANVLYPGRAAATKNREVYAPIAAVLHWAADNKLRDWLRVRKLREDQPVPRIAADHVLPFLIANADDPDLKRFLVVVRWQGWRASETLGLRWEENVDLTAGEFRFRIPKAKAWKQIAMADEVLEELSAVPADRRTGKVFRWSSYQSMDYHLKKLCRKLKVTWTPHMARHGFATDLNDAGATISDIAGAGSWTSEKAVARYITNDVRRAKATLAKLRSAGNGQ